MTPYEVAAELERLFTEEGAAEYFGEAVTQATHMLQAADRARAAGASDALTAAALLHDVGHFTGAVEPGYFDLLSEASVYTLNVQGGPMGPAEAERFAAGPYARQAVALRRWDEAAKVPDARVPDFGHYRELLAGLVRARAAVD